MNIQYYDYYFGNDRVFSFLRINFDWFGIKSIYKTRCNFLDAVRKICHMSIKIEAEKNCFCFVFIASNGGNEFLVSIVYGLNVYVYVYVCVLSINFLKLRI